MLLFTMLVFLIMLMLLIPSTRSFLRFPTVIFMLMMMTSSYRILDLI